MKSVVDELLAVAAKPGEWSPSAPTGFAVRLGDTTDLETMRREFDEAFYRAQNPEPRISGRRSRSPISPPWVGGRGGIRRPGFRSPTISPNTKTSASEAVNPFLHYLLHGRREGRNIERSPAQPSRAPAAKLQGNFEHIGGGVAKGWAFDGRGRHPSDDRALAWVQALVHRDRGRGAG